MINVGGKDYIYDGIVFLDIDGVLNSAEWNMERHKTYQQWRAENSDASRGEILIWRHIDDSAVARLNRLLKVCNLGIVLSSTWRILDVTREALKLAGIDQWDNRLLGVTEQSRGDSTRGREIQNWIIKNNYSGPFIMLDDDIDAGPVINNLVLTNFYFGLTDEIVEKAVDKLKNRSNLS